MRARVCERACVCAREGRFVWDSDWSLGRWLVVVELILPYLFRVAGDSAEVCE